MGKQMEGDNRERRKKAKEARDEGQSASEAHVTTGASKQRHHEPQSADDVQKLDSLREGKQDGGVQQHLPEGRPGRRPSDLQEEGR